VIFFAIQYGIEPKRKLIVLFELITGIPIGDSRRVGNGRYSTGTGTGDLRKESSMEYALFTLMWLAVALLAILGARIALGIILDLRERLGRR
jgi:hypothetical protein